MHFRHRHFASWLIGLFGLVAVVWYFQPNNFSGTVRSVGIPGALAWLVLTMFARVLLVEITIIPLQVLGFRLRRSDAFWIGWLRSFSNQILPLSGLAFYAHEIRRKVGISWLELASLSTPQFFLAALALGLIGIVATGCSIDIIGQAAIPMMVAYFAVSGGAVLFATKSAWLIEALPEALSSRADDAAASFRKLTQYPQLTSKLVCFHCAAILIRGGRLWMLFAATGTQLDWREALLMVAVAESATLFQITPGGLGLREGAVVGAAALLHISPDVGAGVALIDRLFIIGTTTALAAPAFVLTRRRQVA